MIPPETIQTIKDRADILAVVGAEVRLKRAGALYHGLCPFHQEKTPSFTVNSAKNSYHCFGCGEHGDSLKFLQKYNSLSFPDAVRALATIVGVEVVEEQRGTPEQQRARKVRKDRQTRLLELHASLMELYRTSLARSPQARAYLEERGVSEEAAAAFELGWASDDVPLFYEWMRRADASADDLIEIGAIRPHDPDDAPERAARGDARLNGGALRFRNRLMCPVFDSQGRSIGFSGRIIHSLSKAPKYLNTPETPLFTKGRSLYGLKTAREACRSAAGAEAPLLVCEGNLDVVSMWQAGFKKIVAPMGTALTPEQAQLMRRLSATVICVMDGDSAGQKAAFKSLPILLAAGLRVRAVVLPPSEDPDSFVRSYGPKEMESLIAAAQPLLMIYLQSRVEALPRDTFGQAQVAREVLPLVALIEDTYERPLFLDEVARVVGVDRLYLTRQLEEVLRAQQAASPLQRPVAARAPSDPVLRQARGPTEPPGEVAYDPYYDPSYDPSSGPSYDPSYDPSHGDAGGAPYDPLDGDDPHGALRPAPQGGRGGGAERRGWQGERRAQGDAPPSQWWVGEAEKLKQVELRRQGLYRPRPVSVTGQIEINAPESPAPFTRVKLGAGARQLLGFEREALSLLYYQPHLLSPFIEQGGLEDLSQPLAAEFLRALHRVYADTGYVGDEGLLAQVIAERGPSAALAAELQDCLAARPFSVSVDDQARQLLSVQRKLRERRLADDFKRAVAALTALEREGGDPSGAAAARASVERANQALNAFRERPQGPSKAS